MSRARGALLIAGPTASGKSALASVLAQRLGGVVINADSMQVYADLRILTARPGAEDQAAVPHRLYGHVPAAEAYSVGRWLDDMREILAEAGRCGLKPIVVGGTGLYFSALTGGLSDMPRVPDDIRAYWRGRAGEEGAPALHAALAARDPGMAARLRPSDPQRVVRALEVLDATGRSLSEWQGLRGVALVEPEMRLVVDLPREDLAARIDARSAAMLEAGALAEVEALLARGLDQRLPAMKALGVAALGAHLRGEISLDEALLRVQAGTRGYARRQMTWFRNRFADWPRLRPQDAAEAVLARMGET